MLVNVATHENKRMKVLRIAGAFVSPLQVETLRHVHDAALHHVQVEALHKVDGGKCGGDAPPSSDQRQCAHGALEKT